MARKGQSVSPETKAKMSASHKKVVFTPEWKQHLSEAKKELFRTNLELKARTIANIHKPEVQAKRVEVIRRLFKEKKFYKKDRIK